jgi:peptidoglycan/LPS O-acetylase OafA/YrhL
VVKHIPALYGLRAVAIVLVLIAHLTHTPYYPEFIKSIMGNANLGTIGVRLFFILSGYLITHVLIFEYRKTGKVSIRRFFIRRILRIFPCFYFFLIVLFIFSIFRWVDISHDAIGLAFLYIQNYTVFQGRQIFPSSWLVAHSWSLSVEEQFYLIYPFIFISIFAWIKSRPWLMIIGFILICTFFRALNYSYPHISRMTFGPFFMNADFLFSGCAMRILLSRYKSSLIKLSAWKYLILIVAFTVAIIASVYEYQSGYYIIISGVLILLSNIIIFMVVIIFPDSRLGKVLDMKSFIFIGKLSYSLYVWQQLFLGSTSYWLKYKFVTFFPLNILLVFLLAFLSYTFIEKPFLKLKLRFAV